ncbi:DNA-binding MarR family transcriptional regulator [Streptomyces puniciscabiei]|uniref:DNA-binding MarR family transcriptional regulator n=1 Tax=Streptomyces puniciscabiei TaxID=164348 RepID=A0A542UF16_9ACTN|nr:MarR family winged helix-turn-helix transcriptional regulator [Streptomyces puniciscabiei]TQK97637.1 DNA-binding MarR family transcriptional regulator [Streptomyces puniciscabiei]
MSDVNGATAGDAPGLASTVVFRLGTLGTVVTDRFTREIEGLDLKPKHVGLMAALSRAAVASQQELAARMGVAPSLMVSLADHLEGLGAVRRVRDPRDRRRQALTLTEEGRDLLDRCTSLARTLDEELVAGLTEEQRKALEEALRVLAHRAGLP